VHNSRTYLAWRRKQGTHDPPGLNLVHAGDVSPVHGRGHVIYFTTGPGHNPQLADMSTTEGGMAGNVLTSRPTTATAAAAGAPSIEMRSGMTKQEIREVLDSGQALEITWYVFFSLIWGLLTVFLWSGSESLRLAMRWQVVFIFVSHIITIMVSCCS
jgi:hypothetical protein